MPPPPSKNCTEEKAKYLSSLIVAYRDIHTHTQASEGRKASANQPTNQTSKVRLTSTEQATKQATHTKKGKHMTGKSNLEWLALHESFLQCGPGVNSAAVRDAFGEASVPDGLKGACMHNIT